MPPTMTRRLGADDGGSNGSGNRGKPPKQVSLTDPQAAWVARKNTDPFFAYDANYLIDNKAGIIVDAEGTRANRIAEIAITETMIERVKDRFDLQPRRLAGDTVYGAVRLLKWLVDRQITPHIPVWDKSARSDGTFSRADFVFDRSRNIYICPNGKLLHTTGTVIDGSTLRYRASKRDCDVCAFKMQCCPHTPARQIPRDLHEDARDVARALAKTEAFEQSRRERKKVEMCFAHMKRIFKLDRLRLRGLSGAKDEVLLTAIAQNLRRLVKYPLPTATIGVGHLCGVAGLPSVCADNAVRRSQRRTPQADQCSNPPQRQKAAQFCNTIHLKATKSLRRIK